MNLLLTLLVFSVVFSTIEGYSNVNLRVATISNPPFVIVNEKATNGQKFTGLSIDLFNAVIKMAGENNTAEYYIPPDGIVGNRNPNTGQWNGIIGELTSNNANVGVATIRLNPERSSAVIFSPSYSSVGLQVMVSKADRGNNFLGFFQPFTTRLWGWLLATVILIAVFTWLLDKCSPFGWRKQTKRRRRYNLPIALISSFKTISNQEGRGPKAWSAQLLLIMYFFFAMVILATYTANLTANLTYRSNSYSPINGVDDLRRNKYPFAVIAGEYAHQFFNSTTITTYSLAQPYMRVYNNVEDALRALKSSEVKAFIHDSTILNYLVNQVPCNTLLVGDVFQTSSYGFAFPTGGDPTIIAETNRALLNVQQSGTSDDLFNKWFSSLGTCTATDQIAQIDVSDVAGLWFGLVIFLVIGILILLLEWIIFKGKCCFKNLNKFCGGGEYYGSDDDDD